MIYQEVSSEAYAREVVAELKAKGYSASVSWYMKLVNGAYQMIWCYAVVAFRQSQAA